ncbi:MAG: hypothetical protein VX460_07430 [Planctomycetota bacterium]|nr:hypothetical protein [Planctomycetota bacterium]
MLLTLTTALVLSGQESAPAVPAATDEPTAPAVGTTADELRARIRDMRMNLLLGGDQVRRAEEQAVDFYASKARSVGDRLDDVATELVELQATYDMALQRALAERGTAAGQEALREAAPLRRRIGDLELEADSLEARRERLSGLVDAVEARDRERRKLVDELESASVDGDELGMPMMSIGLAPNVPAPVEDAAPLADGALFEDLMSRDARGARALLHAEDPEAYWERFPLTPPREVLRGAIRLPLPDPVGWR